MEDRKSSSPLFCSRLVLGESLADRERYVDEQSVLTKRDQLPKSASRIGILSTRTRSDGSCSKKRKHYNHFHKKFNAFEEVNE